MRKRKVLFFCKHNACRSQMAEGLLRAMAGERFDVFSAGLRPRPVYPQVHLVMAEHGIDVSAQTSKGIDLYAGRELFEFIIIVCKESEADCPTLYPFAIHVERWPLDDPASVSASTREAGLAAFRNTRDDLEKRLRDWLELHG
jgi:arsenate reductase